MRFLFHPEADAELDRAVEYYEQCRSGLGLEFAEEVYAAIVRISRYPDAGSPMSENTRRSLINRFPYGIIYRLKNNFLHIIAVAHLHRQPGYWEKRIESNNRTDSTGQ